MCNEHSQVARLVFKPLCSSYRCLSLKPSGGGRSCTTLSDQFTDWLDLQTIHALAGYPGVTA